MITLLLVRRAVIKWASSSTPGRARCLCVDRGIAHLRADLLPSQDRWIQEFPLLRHAELARLYVYEAFVATRLVVLREVCCAHLVIRFLILSLLAATQDVETSGQNHDAPFEPVQYLELLHHRSELIRR